MLFKVADWNYNQLVLSTILVSINFLSLLFGLTALDSFLPVSRQVWRGAIQNCWRSGVMSFVGNNHFVDYILLRLTVVDNGTHAFSVSCSFLQISWCPNFLNTFVPKAVKLCLLFVVL